MSDQIVTMEHVRKAGMCSRGGRQWAAAHGLDWSDFLKNGIQVSVLQGLNDAFADRLVAVVLDEED